MAAKDGLTTETRAALAALKDQFPGDWLVKVARVRPDGAVETIPDGALGFHRVPGTELGDLEGWLLRHPLCGAGSTYSVQVYRDDGSGKPKGAPKHSMRVATANPAESARMAEAGFQAAASAQADTERMKLQRELEQGQQTMSEQTKVLEQAAQMAGDPARATDAQKLVAEAMTKLAESSAKTEARMVAFQQALARTPAAPAAPAQPQGWGAWPPVAPQGLPAHWPLPAPTTKAPDIVPIPGVGMLINGQFVPTQQQAPRDDMRAELDRVREEARRQADLFKVELDREREARREAERKADDARREAERKADAARMEAQLAEIRRASEAQIAELRRAADKPVESQSDKLLPVLMASSDARLAEASRAVNAANERMMQYLQEAANADPTQAVRGMLSTVGDVITLQNGMTQQLLRQAATGGSTEKKEPLWLAPATKLIDNFGMMAVAALGGGAPPAQEEEQHQATHTVNVEEPRREQPMLPAPQIPATAQALLDDAREAAKAGAMQDALMYMQSAFKRHPGFVMQGEDVFAATRRLLDGYADTALIAQIQAPQQEPEQAPEGAEEDK